MQLLLLLLLLLLLRLLLLRLLVAFNWDLATHRQTWRT
jgi:hypothetical protein